MNNSESTDMHGYQFQFNRLLPVWLSTLPISSLALLAAALFGRTCVSAPTSSSVYSGVSESSIASEGEVSVNLEWISCG